MCLDKDILNKGNKIYSPDNCIIAPIKEVADRYKDKIPSKLYKAMYGYEVEIDD